MDKNTFIEKIKEIGLSEDEINRRTLLSELSDEVSKVFDSVESNTNTIDELNKTIEQNNKDMESLRQANMELFKRIGSDEGDGAITPPTKTEEPEPELKYDDLFDEKGMIKR